MDLRQDWATELLEFVAGKRIVEIVHNNRSAMNEYGIHDDNAFDLVFDDGTSLELYVIDNKLGWVIVDTPSENLRE